MELPAPSSRYSDLAQLRRAAGLTQRELAVALGIKSIRTITSWESGANAPHVRYVLPLARILGVSVREVVEAVAGSDRTPGEADRYVADRLTSACRDAVGTKAMLASLAQRLDEATELVRRLQDEREVFEFASWVMGSVEPDD